MPKRDTKNVLVAGGAGYIGSHTCKALAQAGYRPVVYDDLSFGHRRAVQWGPLVEGNLADAALLVRALDEYQIGAIMHFAAFTSVGESVRAPEAYFRNNVASTLTLIEAAIDSGIQDIVFSSTAATYGNPEKDLLDETHPNRPINPYGESKLMVEAMLRWCGDAHDLRWMALRYFNAAGADTQARIGEDHDPETHLIPLVLQTALGARPFIQVFGNDYPTPDGTAIRDYIHVDDLASAHVRALERLRNGGQSLAVNLGTGKGCSVREVISACERATGRAIPMRIAARRTGDPAVLVADSARARALLQWRPRSSDLDTIVGSAWRWHLKVHKARYQQPAMPDEPRSPAPAALPQAHRGT